MKRSETIANLAMSLAKFQGEMTNPKNTAKNPQFNSKYAPLQDILALARPILSKHGLSLIQSTTGDLENVTISTMLMHESGEFLETEPFILKGEQTMKGGGKVLNVQGAGSMITYIRRYQVSAMLGVASEDDDDGAHSTGYKGNDKHDDKEPEIPKGNYPPKPKDEISSEITPLICSTPGCKTTINQAIKTFSEKTYGKSLCMICQKKEGTQIA